MLLLQWQEECGTRLGYNGPKGTFLVNIKPKPKYIFEILANTLEQANKKYNVVIPWYIMTSNDNHEETIDFFEKHSYFNYPKNSISFFNQGQMPLLSESGNFLLDGKNLIQFAADGNGSIYRSMKQEGILKDMKKRNIEWIYICSVDNILLKMVEPTLVGLTISQGNEIASKTVAKKNPQEKVGVFCLKNGKPSVIEYSELPQDMAEATDENGNLLFGESHIMCNLFSLNALEKIANTSLPYHFAHKKAAFYENGTKIEPTTPNAYKLEAFIFDAFSQFENITLLRGKREEDFAPIKNKQGVDSPETAIKLYNALFSK